jgi:nucleoside-diphosphate-sugar epimerase
MTIAVTGATGYVGAVLVERLLAAGASVRALVRNPQSPLPAGVERAVVDLTIPSGLETALRGAEVVVHCAAEQRSPSRANHQAVNVAGTRALLDAALVAGVRRVVHLSSIAVYPRRDGNLPVSPDDPLDPFPELRDAYAWSKIGAERWVALHRRVQGLDAITLRLGIVYGRGRDFVARVWRRLVGPVIVVAGSPRMLLPLVHVGDVAEAVWRVVDARRLAAPVLNVVGPETPTQASYLARRGAYRPERLMPLYVSLGAFQRLAERRAWAHALQLGARGSRAYALAWSAQRTRYDLRPTERALGWAPRIGLDEGLQGPLPSGAVSIAVAG